MGDSNNLPRINMVLLGNDGHGKSSFGNFILNKKTFQVTGKGLASNKILGYGAGIRGNFEMKVVEMPASSAGSNEMIKTAYNICDHNLHLFLLIIKFDGENTGNCLQVFDKWREILDSDIFKRRGVIVITFGDEFKRLMEKNNTPDRTFSEWCFQQDGNLLNLIQECNPRCILFDNIVQPEHTFKELSNYMRQLSHTDYKFNVSTRSQNNSSSWGNEEFVVGGVVVGFLGAVLVCLLVCKR